MLKDGTSTRERIAVEWRIATVLQVAMNLSYSLISNRTYIGVFGPGCSVPAVIIGLINSSEDSEQVGS